MLFTITEFVTIMDECPNTYKKLLETLGEDSSSKDIDYYLKIYKTDKKSIDNILKKYEEFDRKIEEKICAKLKSDNIEFACCNFLDIINIEYNAFDMEDVLSKIVENREKIKKAVLERSKKVIK